MKYMLLIYNNPESLKALEPDMDKIFAEVDALMTELQESGEWIGGEALADASQAKVVRIRDGAPAITDGPYLEAKEHFCGYCIFECETLDRALEIAARWPDARYAGVELRPLMTQAAADV